MRVFANFVFYCCEYSGSTKSASLSESTSSSRSSSPAPPYSRTHAIKREESDSANKLLASHQSKDTNDRNGDGDTDVPMKTEPKELNRNRIVTAVRKRHREESNDSSTSTSDPGVRKNPAETGSRRVIGM
jgi:hypothetical protein